MGKSFKERIQQRATNPTLQFISQPEERREEAVKAPQAETKRKPKVTTAATSGAPQAAPQVHRALPHYDNPKSRRVQLLLTPSLYDAVKAKATQEGTSVNDMINTILTRALRK